MVSLGKSLLNFFHFSRLNLFNFSHIMRTSIEPQDSTGFPNIFNEQGYFEVPPIRDRIDYSLDMQRRSSKDLMYAFRINFRMSYVSLSQSYVTC